MAEKQLIVVVEGTAALSPYWQTILSDYLQKIIRCFYENELTGQKFSGETPELAMVVFYAHGPCSDFLVQRSGWTKDLDVFFRRLSGISFSGGGFSDVAIAEGLSEALLMFPITTNGSQPHQNFDTQKHCILIAASNPHSVPTPIFRPLIPSLEHNEKVEVQPETCLADAEAVAKSLGQCSVSLSVISPKPLLKLRGIYNAGKRISRAADPVVDHSKNPDFLVLLSENFMEARAALSSQLAGNVASNQNNIKVDVTSSGNLIPGPTSATISKGNGSVVNRQAVSMGNIPTATVKVEPTILPSLGSGAAFSHMPPISMVPAMNNNSTMNMPLTQHGSSFQQNQSKYVKTWEGALSGQRQGLPVFICKLEGYRSTTASETIAADWPESMQIVRLTAQDHMNNKQYVGKVDFVVFRTLNPHEFLGQLQEKKLCAVIQLPSQTLLLSVSDKAGRLIGMLFPGATSQQQQQMVLGSAMNHQQQQQHMGMGQQPQQMVGPGVGQQPQQMVGSGMGQQQMAQAYGPGGNMSSGGFLPDGHH